MNQVTSKFLEDNWPGHCAHLKEVASELKLKADAGQADEEVLYAELLAAFSMGQDSD